MYNRVLFIGSKESGLKVLEQIHKAAPDKLAGCVTVDDFSDSRSQLKAFKQYCENNKIRLSILSGKCDLSEVIHDFKPDICFVMGWYYIIPKRLIDEVSGGFIGIHNSLLPSHRGFAPVVWSMIGGEGITGFSVFSFDDGMDTGDVWYQEEIEIEEDDYISDVLNKIDDRIQYFFESHYMEILSGDLTPSKQVLCNVSYGAKRTEEDGCITWSKGADEIYNFIRAQSKPYPGAFTTYRGQKVIIWRADKFPYPIQGKPGQIGLIDEENKEIVVVCGNSTGLVIKIIEIEGKEIMTIDYIKTLNYSFGS